MAAIKPAQMRQPVALSPRAMKKPALAMESGPITLKKKASECLVVFADFRMLTQ